MKKSQKRSNQKTGKLISFVLSFILLFSFFLTSCSFSKKERATRDGFYFDTIISITLFGTHEDNERLFEGCFSLAEKYENLFSTEITSSDVSRINNSGGAPVSVDPETFLLVEKGINYEKLSGGKFSITCGGLTALWNISKRAETLDTDSPLPENDEIIAALSSVGCGKLSLNDEKCEITLLDKNTRLDLGGIAKGYIADKMKEYLLSENCRNAIINLGGNVLCLGKNPNGKDIKVGVQKPFSDPGDSAFILPVDSLSVVTSGNYQRYFEKDGELYHHILDLSTGYPAKSGLDSVTIVSDDSVDGDALSTICFILGKDGSETLLNSLRQKNPGKTYEAVFIDSDKRIETTNGLKDIIDIR